MAFLSPWGYQDSGEFGGLSGFLTSGPEAHSGNFFSSLLKNLESGAFSAFLPGLRVGPSRCVRLVR